MKKIIAYLIKTFNGMAFGLFTTLIIGVIIAQIGKLTEINEIIELSDTVKSLMGIGIAVGIAWSLNLTGLNLIAAVAMGGVATSITKDPLAIYFTCMLSFYILSLILIKKTSFDIIIIPLLSILSSFLIALAIHTPIEFVVSQLGEFIRVSTDFTPFFMGMLISVLMGMALTAPISSAALAISLGLDGIAGGAAAVGCSIQMIGFAIMSRKDNNIGTVISIAIGTSMLQFKNIVKKPIIWLPTIIASAILGPISTLLFKLETSDIGSGMGTSGLVGQIATFDAMGYSFKVFIYILLMHIIFPLILVYTIDLIFRKKNLIVEGDLSV